MEWNHILRQIENGNQPIYKREEEEGVTLLDKFVADVKQALEHDDNHFHNKGTELPARMSNTNDPVVSWEKLREITKLHPELHDTVLQGVRY